MITRLFFLCRHCLTNAGYQLTKPGTTLSPFTASPLTQITLSLTASFTALRCVYFRSTQNAQL